MIRSRFLLKVFPKKAVSKNIRILWFRILKSKAAPLYRVERWKTPDD
ncbi:hypothetical protein [Desulfobacterium sp. N47]